MDITVIGLLGRIFETSIDTEQFGAIEGISYLRWLAALAAEFRRRFYDSRLVSGLTLNRRRRRQIPGTIPDTNTIRRLSGAGRGRDCATTVVDFEFLFHERSTRSAPPIITASLPVAGIRASFRDLRLNQTIFDFGFNFRIFDGRRGESGYGTD
ncbi:hypothetical protein KCP77_17605 [Salmonella enterica subsp. enterica]|nr:hypothetical protein KCP77_17605 [Salmonella enterica subsp. enterica]